MSLIEKNKKPATSRRIKEVIFKAVTFLSLLFAVSMVFVLIFSVAIKGYTAFFTNYVVINVNPSVVAQDTKQNIKQQIINNVLANNANADITYLQNIDIAQVISNTEFNDFASKLSNMQQPSQYKLLLVSNLDMYLKNYVNKNIINQNVLQVVNLLQSNNLLQYKLNTHFFSNSDSRYAESAGIKGALVGTGYVVLLTMLFAIIISICAAIYLEEFANKNSRLVGFIDININNLAAVPSIIFGLLGLVIFENFFGVPRGTPLLASLILTLMVLPTIIITTKIALSAVPKIIKEASYGLGASKLQVLLGHSIPMSLPGIITGVIISVSRVIGETAPLLMIGMMSFTNNPPASILDNAVVMPIQILLWFNNPEAGYAEKASGAILVLLLIIFVINLLSSLLRSKFEKKYK